MLRADADPIVSYAESRCVNSWLFNFSIHQDIKIAIQQVLLQWQVIESVFQLLSHHVKRWEIKGAEINVCRTLL